MRLLTGLLSLVFPVKRRRGAVRTVKVAAIAMVAALLATVSWAPTATADDADVVRSGQWQKKTYAAQGSWKIVRKGDRNTLVFSEDFAVPKGPDLKIFLSPLPLAQVKSANATQGAQLVARLKTNTGTQSIEVPAGVDLTKYQSVLIHCERYSKLFSASSL